jgi:hypothetical protein
MMRFLIRSGIPETPGTTVSTCEKKVVLVRDQKMWREKREGGVWGVYIVVDGHGGFNPMASLAAKELRKGERRRNWG